MDLNFSRILCLSIKVLSLFINSEKGKQKEFCIEPLLSPFLGSEILPSNLPLLLASITLNSLELIFLSISFLLFTSSFLNLYSISIIH